MMCKYDPRRQPEDWYPEQLLVTASHPQCKMLYDVPDTEHGSLWRAVAKTATDNTLARERQQHQERGARLRPTKSSTMATTPSQRRESGRKHRSDQNSNRAAKQIRWEFMASFRAQAGPTASSIPAAPVVE